ncbi:MAG: DM13 domain-containing protein [Rhodobacteraceae bacterium]|nr:DM13 domain-containing protein [Paracoccaceae bacterium]
MIPLATLPVFAGALKGLNGHTASGSATINNAKVELGTDFLFDGGPDVYVAVRKDGKVHLLAKLRDNSGAQSYSLPNNLSLGDNDEILLFCKKYNVTLGKAPAN